MYILYKIVVAYNTSANKGAQKHHQTSGFPRFNKFLGEAPIPYACYVRGNTPPFRRRDGVLGFAEFGFPISNIHFHQDC